MAVLEARIPEQPGFTLWQKLKAFIENNSGENLPSIEEPALHEITEDLTLLERINRGLILTFSKASSLAFSKKETFLQVIHDSFAKRETELERAQAQLQAQEQLRMQKMMQGLGLTNDATPEQIQHAKIRIENKSKPIEFRRKLAQLKFEVKKRKSWVGAIARAITGFTAYDLFYKMTPLRVIGKLWTTRLGDVLPNTDASLANLSGRELAARLEEKILGYRTGAIEEEQVRWAIYGGVEWAMKMKVLPTMVAQLPAIKFLASNPAELRSLWMSISMAAGLPKSAKEFFKLLNQAESPEEKRKMIAALVLTTPVFGLAKQIIPELCSGYFGGINLALMSNLFLSKFLEESRHFLEEAEDDDTTQAYRLLQSIQTGMRTSFMIDSISSVVTTLGTKVMTAIETGSLNPIAKVQTEADLIEMMKNHKTREYLFGQGGGIFGKFSRARQKLPVLVRAKLGSDQAKQQLAALEQSQHTVQIPIYEDGEDDQSPTVYQLQQTEEGIMALRLDGQGQVAVYDSESGQFVLIPLPETDGEPDADSKSEEVATTDSRQSNEIEQDLSQEQESDESSAVHDYVYESDDGDLLLRLDLAQTESGLESIAAKVERLFSGRFADELDQDGDLREISSEELKSIAGPDAVYETQIYNQLIVGIISQAQIAGVEIEVVMDRFEAFVEANLEPDGRTLLVEIDRDTLFSFLLDVETEGIPSMPEVEAVLADTIAAPTTFQVDENGLVIGTFAKHQNPRQIIESAGLPYQPVLSAWIRGAVDVDVIRNGQLIDNVSPEFLFQAGDKMLVGGDYIEVGDLEGLRQVLISSQIVEDIDIQLLLSGNQEPRSELDSEADTETEQDSDTELFEEKEEEDPASTGPAELESSPEQEALGPESPPASLEIGPAVPTDEDIIAESNNLIVFSSEVAAGDTLNSFIRNRIPDRMVDGLLSNPNIQIGVINTDGDFVPLADLDLIRPGQILAMREVNDDETFNQLWSRAVKPEIEEQAETPEVAPEPESEDVDVEPVEAPLQIDPNDVPDFLRINGLIEVDEEVKSGDTLGEILRPFAKYLGEEDVWNVYRTIFNQGGALVIERKNSNGNGTHQIVVTSVASILDENSPVNNVRPGDKILIRDDGYFKQVIDERQLLEQLDGYKQVRELHPRLFEESTAQGNVTYREIALLIVEQTEDDLPAAIAEQLRMFDPNATAYNFSVNGFGQYVFEIFSGRDSLEIVMEPETFEVISMHAHQGLEEEVIYLSHLTEGDSSVPIFLAINNPQTKELLTNARSDPAMAGFLEQIVDTLLKSDEISAADFQETYEQLKRELPYFESIIGSGYRVKSPQETLVSLIVMAIRQNRLDDLMAGQVDRYEVLAAMTSGPNGRGIGSSNFIDEGVLYTGEIIRAPSGFIPSKEQLATERGVDPEDIVLKQVGSNTYLVGVKNLSEFGLHARSSFKYGESQLVGVDAEGNFIFNSEDQDEIVAYVPLSGSQSEWIVTGRRISPNHGEIVYVDDKKVVVINGEPERTSELNSDGQLDVGQIILDPNTFELYAIWKDENGQQELIPVVGYEPSNQEMFEFLDPTQEGSLVNVEDEDYHEEKPSFFEWTQRVFPYLTRHKDGQPDEDGEGLLIHNSEEKGEYRFFTTNVNGEKMLVVNSAGQMVYEKDGEFFTFSLQQGFKLIDSQQLFPLTEFADKSGYQLATDQEGRALSVKSMPVFQRDGVYYVLHPEGLVGIGGLQELIRQSPQPSEIFSQLCTDIKTTVVDVDNEGQNYTNIPLKARWVKHFDIQHDDFVTPDDPDGEPRLFNLRNGERYDLSTEMVNSDGLAVLVGEDGSFYLHNPMSKFGVNTVDQEEVQSVDEFLGERGLSPAETQAGQPLYSRLERFPVFEADDGMLYSLASDGLHLLGPRLEVMRYGWVVAHNGQEWVEVGGEDLQEARLTPQERVARVMDPVAEKLLGSHNSVIQLGGFLAQKVSQSNDPMIKVLGELLMGKMSAARAKTTENLNIDLGDVANSSYVDLERVSPYLIRALVVSEQEDYWTNDSFSSLGLLRTLYARVKHGEFVIGGSTIAQQTAKQLSRSTEEAETRTIRRKMGDWVLGRALFEQLGREQILEVALNAHNYGGFTKGVESAAQRYFSKSARDLNLGEAALLAVVPQSPGQYNTQTYENARRWVDRAMINIQQQLDSGFITEDDAAQAIRSISSAFLPSGDSRDVQFLQQVLQHDADFDSSKISPQVMIAYQQHLRSVDEPQDFYQFLHQEIGILSDTQLEMVTSAYYQAENPMWRQKQEPAQNAQQRRYRIAFGLSDDDDQQELEARVPGLQVETRYDNPFYFDDDDGPSLEEYHHFNQLDLNSPEKKNLSEDFIDYLLTSRAEDFDDVQLEGLPTTASVTGLELFPDGTYSISFEYELKTDVGTNSDVTSRSRQLLYYFIQKEDGSFAISHEFDSVKDEFFVDARNVTNQFFHRDGRELNPDLDYKESDMGLRPGAQQHGRYVVLHHFGWQDFPDVKISHTIEEILPRFERFHHSPYHAVVMQTETGEWKAFLLRDLAETSNGIYDTEVQTDSGQTVRLTNANAFNIVVSYDEFGSNGQVPAEALEVVDQLLKKLDGHSDLLDPDRVFVHGELPEQGDGSVCMLEIKEQPVTEQMIVEMCQNLGLDIEIDVSQPTDKEMAIQMIRERLGLQPGQPLSVYHYLKTSAETSRTDVVQVVKWLLSTTRPDRGKAVVDLDILLKAGVVFNLGDFEETGDGRIKLISEAYNNAEQNAQGEVIVINQVAEGIFYHPESQRLYKRVEGGLQEIAGAVFMDELGQPVQGYQINTSNIIISREVADLKSTDANIFSDMEGNCFEVDDRGRGRFLGRILPLINGKKILAPIGQQEMYQTSQHSHSVWATVLVGLGASNQAKLVPEFVSDRNISTEDWEQALSDSVRGSLDPNVGARGSLDNVSYTGVNPRAVERAVESSFPGVEVTPIEIIPGVSGEGTEAFISFLTGQVEASQPVAVWLNYAQHPAAKMVGNDRATDVLETPVEQEEVVLLTDVFEADGEKYVVYFNQSNYGGRQQATPTVLSMDQFLQICLPDTINGVQVGRYKALAFSDYQLPEAWKPYEVEPHDDTRQAELAFSVGMNLVDWTDEVDPIVRTTTISPVFQKEVLPHAEQAITASGSDGFAAVFLNPDTGEIIADISLDADGRPTATNRATMEPFFFGSTVKTMTAAFAMDKMGLSPREVLKAGRAADLFGIKIENWGNAAAAMNLTQALIYSNNPFFINLYQELLDRGMEPEALAQYFQEIGIGESEHIPGLLNAPGTVLTEEEDKYIGMFALQAIGQGNLRMTVEDMARWAAIIANDGREVNPVIMRKPEARESPTDFVAGDHSDGEQPRQIITPESAEVIQTAMRRVVLSGTAVRAFSGMGGVEIYGKTGTAETIRVVTDGDGNQRIRTEPNAVFMGYVVHEDQKMAFAILLPNGGEGSNAAADAARRIIEVWLKQQAEGDLESVRLEEVDPREIPPGILDSLESDLE